MLIYNIFWMWTICFCRVDYLYVSDTRTRAIFKMRKRDGGGNIMIRQGVTGIMNVKAYTADLHSGKFRQRKALESQKRLGFQSYSN